MVGLGLGLRTRKAAPDGMAEKLDLCQVVTLEELLRSIVYEQKALRHVLVRRGLLSNKDVFEEIEAIRQELLEDVKAVRRH
ncbi:MAG: hypothetical protein ACE5JQ_11570 [Candidatus Methylomirabilales bacterium]